MGFDVSANEQNKIINETWFTISSLSFPSSRSLIRVFCAIAYRFLFVIRFFLWLFLWSIWITNLNANSKFKRQGKNHIHMMFYKLKTMQIAYLWIYSIDLLLIVIEWKKIRNKCTWNKRKRTYHTSDAQASWERTSNIFFVFHPKAE